MGFEYQCPQLPSLGPDSKGITYKADVEAIQRTAFSLFDQGKEVALIAHSAGGVPACVATQGLTISQRAKEGKPGGFRHIIFLAAFAIPVRGYDLLQTLGGTWPDWQIAGEPYTKGHLIHLQEFAKDKFYNDLPDNEAQKQFESLLPHSQDAFETPVNFIPADVTIPKTYIICENDQALPVEVQRELVSQTPGLRAETLDTGHSPFLSQPDKCAELMRKVLASE
ncbi:hypothetical protein JX265_005253 [Neoarthrinium moseri]|uniref:AB hydrolase-1 domain-containing protein n=1 Tax=Neoarthrinium moseri TaxID=1658444 RepID=A0A9P9WPE6_9PEZI|nr:hypothetical protein JX266_008487 [Neoarthrinium moseri]KAI1873631.1 hypothetical protein JX265_005253 [Neoarthrinium moseri]